MNVTIDPASVPGLIEAAEAVWQWSSEEGYDTLRSRDVRRVTEVALASATGPIIAAAFADMSDDLAILGLDEAAHYLDLVSQQLRGAP